MYSASLIGGSSPPLNGMFTLNPRPCLSPQSVNPPVPGKNIPTISEKKGMNCKRESNCFIYVGVHFSIRNAHTGSDEIKNDR